MSGLTILDVCVLIALLWGTVSGFLRGFVQEVLSLGAIIAALFVLRLGHELATLWLMKLTGGETTASVIAFVLIVGLVWGGGKMAARRIGKLMRNSIIGPFDRVLGAGFGFLKALLIAATLFMLLSLGLGMIYSRDEPAPAWIAESRTYPLLRATGAALSDVVAKQLQTQPLPAVESNPAGATAP